LLVVGQRDLETSERETHAGSLDRSPGGDPIGVDLDPDHSHVRANPGQPVMEFEDRDGGCAVAEIDDDRRGDRCTKATRESGRDPPIVAAQAIRVRGSARDHADRLASRHVHEPRARSRLRWRS